jgi:Ca2+-binding EF-hand superfamily protein
MPYFCIRSFDPGNTGKIGEVQFRKIMKSKEAIPEEDIEEMLSGIRGHSN